MTATSPAVNSKWTRRNIIALWDGQPYVPGEKSNWREIHMAECDRIMIALYRFQTDGRVSYRRLVGMHGGGGGTCSEEFKRILHDKMLKDIERHYQGKFPDSGYWPNPVPNSPPPTLVGATDDDRCFAYTFCWHGQPEFLLWHRPLMAEFERGLQDHDPQYDGLDPSDPARHSGSDALGCPYWAWEGWDGLSLPQVLANPYYVVKTPAWEKSGFPKGFSFRNPFHRWQAPVSIDNQKKEIFAETLTEHNTTSRDAAFDDPGAEFGYPWPQVTAPRNPSMIDVVVNAMNNPNWSKFCTTKEGGMWSIENPHNKFHNHVGGVVLGGIQGSGVQKDETTDSDFTGTMAQNQSIFDPIFWLHHGNVERQLLSWQKRFANQVTSSIPDKSKPSEESMRTVLYPWTKPGNLFRGQLSWNTRSSEAVDGTVGDWWEHATLPYKYDEYLDPAPSGPYGAGIIPLVPTTRAVLDVIISIEPAKYKGGEYALWYKDELVGTIAILSGQGSVCARCAERDVAKIRFDASETFETSDIAKAIDIKSLRLTRNAGEIEILAFTVDDEN